MKKKSLKTSKEKKKRFKFDKLNQEKVPFSKQTKK